VLLPESLFGDFLFRRRPFGSFARVARFSRS